MSERFEKVHRRKLRDHKNTLLLVEQPLLVGLLIAVVALFGVETYYQNVVSADCETTFIGGFWSVCCGLILGLELIRRRSTFRWFYDQKERDGVTEIEEHLIFDDQGLRFESMGYSSFALDWSLLWKYKETRKMFRIHMGGNTFQLRKKFLSADEVEAVGTVLAERKAAQVVARPSTPPPIPKS